MKNNLIALSIFCLAVGIVIESWQISNSLSENKQTSSQSTLLTESGLVSYLGISTEEAKKLGPTSDSPGGTISVLPFLKIGNKVYFSKAAVDKWLINNQGYSIQ